MEHCSVLQYVFFLRGLAIEKVIVRSQVMFLQVLLIQVGLLCHAGHFAGIFDVLAVYFEGRSRNEEQSESVEQGCFHSGRGPEIYRRQR